LSSKTLTYTAGVIRRHRRQIGSAWRKLGPGQQALLALAYLRKGETFAELAAGFGVGTTTAWRYATETVALLAARSPKLRKALQKAKKAGHAYVAIDGTLIAIDRLAADRPFYSGKHRRHGMNLQVIASPDGEILWVSGPLPDAVHDLNAARIWGIVRELATAGLVVLADKGYHGAGDHIRTPYKGEEQAGIAEGRQPCPRQATRSRRARQRPAQNLAHPPQTPLLPVAGRATGQGHPRSSDPRDRRMKTLSDRRGADGLQDEVLGGHEGNHCGCVVVLNLRLGHHWLPPPPAVGSVGAFHLLPPLTWRDMHPGELMMQQVL
jgi:hypothetical protein